MSTPLPGQPIPDQPAPNPPLPPGRITSVLAVVSLVFGLLGWTVVPVLASVVAVVTGHMARSEIRRDPSLEGDAFALVGLVLGWAMLAFALLAILVLIAFIMFFGGLAALSLGW